MLVAVAILTYSSLVYFAEKDFSTDAGLNCTNWEPDYSKGSDAFVSGQDKSHVMVKSGWISSPQLLKLSGNLGRGHEFQKSKHRTYLAFVQIKAEFETNGGITLFSREVDQRYQPPLLWLDICRGFLVSY